MVNKLRFADVLLTCFREGQEQEWRKKHSSEILPLEERLKQICIEKTMNQQAHADNRIDMKTFLQRRNELESEERILNADLGRMGSSACEETRRFQRALHDGTGYDELLTEFVEKIICTDRYIYEYHLTCGLVLTEETDVKDYNNYGRW